MAGTNSKVTATTVERWLKEENRPAAGERAEHVVDPGLDLVVHHTGPGRWRFRYRPRGVDPATGARFSQRKIALGTTETHALSEAKKAAAALKGRVANGEDPAAQDRAAAASNASAARASVAAARAAVPCSVALENYAALLAQRGRSTKHQRDEVGQVRLGLSAGKLLDKPASAITADDIEGILQACPPGSRAARLGALGRFLQASLRRTGRPIVTAEIDRADAPAPAARRRVLTGPELAAVWNATATVKQPALRALVRFLASTPCRESEAAAMRWRDLDAALTVWTQPDSKNGLPHRFPLTTRAAAILAERRAAAGEAAKPDALVFPGPRSGKAFAGWSNLKLCLDRAACIAPWRFHDLRRTAATVMGEAGHDEALIDLILNHRAARSRGGVTGTYNLSQRWADRVAASAAWEEYLAGAITAAAAGGAPGVVVPMRASASKAA